MKSKTAFKIALTDSEKQEMRRNKVKIKDIPNYAVDELAVIMGVSLERAKEVYALIGFQMIPSIGIRFAEDLISLGYYSINELKGKDATKLTEEFELLKGYWIDPCVEDQFRLAVHYAETGDKTKKWWDFTEERKKYRRENGHPPERPQKAWHEALGVKPGNDNGNLYV